MSPLATIVGCLALAPQVTVPDVLPVEVRAHASRLSREGRFHLDLTLVAREEIPRDYLVRVALDAWADEYTVQDLEPRPAMSRWKPGQEVELDLDLMVPANSELGFGDELVVLVGLVHPELGVLVPPVHPRMEEEGYSLVERLPMPGFLGEGGAAELEAVREEARGLERAGKAPEAWAVLEDALRHAGDDATKELLREDLLRVGRFPAAELTTLEEEVVASRITGEQIRYWRIVAGRLNDRGMRHGALRLLERTGGALSEQQDRAVLGAVGDADRVQSTVDDLIDRIIEECTDEDRAEADALVGRHELTEELMEAARDLAGEGEPHLPAAIETLRRLRQADDRDLRQRARELREELEEAWVAYTPPAEQAEVEAALEHPSFARTEVVASHCFLYIGPRDLVRGIPAESKLHFDLAYVFLTDLFGRKPNPEGDRVTVYFKELFDFGGGIGGGKIIDIGRAEAKPTRPVGVDNGLLYHELTHCVDDTNPIFAGFREGLANLGAAYCFEALDQDSDALHGFESNLEQFRRFFLDRDLEYWRIQNYGPSAGFFLHFVDTYASLGRAEHDWSPLRRFFREYRDAPVRDGRERQIVRALGHYLVRAFGPRAFDDLVRFGFPLEARDRNALSLELEAFDEEDFDEFEDRFGDFPTSPLPRDRQARELARIGGYEDESSQAMRREHGVVDTWMTIGPFFTRGADARCVPFPPEQELDFTAKVPALRNTKDADTRLIWRRPVGTWERHSGNSPVTIDTAGWVHFDYQPYGQRDAAIYAVTSITLEESGPVAIHARADDDVVVFLDGLRLGSYSGRGWNGSSDNGRWRGPFKNLPDAQRFDTEVEAGRHTLLVKIKNRGGPAGVTVALSRPDGTTLPFSCDLEPPAARPEHEEPSWKRIARLDSRSYRSKTKTFIGKFKSQNKAFGGASTDGAVPWRRFTVRPGFPKDSPSNLLWLTPKLTRDLAEARVELELVREGRAPKLMLVLQGEGDDDALSGWSLIVVPHGDDRASLRLERYDRLVYQTEPRELPAGEGSLRLGYELVDGEVSVDLDGELWMDRVPVRSIPGATGVGLATWGTSPSILALEVLTPRR